ncbi:MAG TPA: transporter [Pyrinomonadaceae bacterium]
MYNIQKAVSRLEYAPKLKEIEITDIKKGLGVFVPKPDKAVSFAALKETLKKAGYKLDTADITVAGKLAREGDKWLLVSSLSGQKFLLEGKALSALTAGIEPDSPVEITGIWKTAGEGTSAAQEVIELQSVKKAEAATKTNPVSSIRDSSSEKSAFRYVNADFVKTSPLSVVESEKENNKPLAPIRTTSPGLTVYQGGAITPRLYFIKQHWGNLDVSRQVLDFSVSYTPTPTLQLEAEIPISRMAFDDGANKGSGSGLGNITLWGKYRFFRTVKTYGDRQAAFRFGLELPTGKKTAPTAEQVNAPAFVRQQLTPINGGWSPHFDVSFSQAGGRFIFGGNVEAVLRTTRDGFRLGNEIRLNTDFEYVLLPFDYTKPGKELFVILETTLLARSRGRLNGLEVPGSTSTEFYLSPGLQYAADPQFVIEGSIQLPVFRNSGALALRTDYNLLLGVKYLF